MTDKQTTMPNAEKAPMLWKIFHWYRNTRNAARRASVISERTIGVMWDGPYPEEWFEGDKHKK